jgi:hypothetical protein
MVPLSISGIGTRDAAVIAYLSLHAVPPVTAIEFSLLWFLAFSGMNTTLGAIAWLARTYAKLRRDHPRSPCTDAGKRAKMNL